MIAIGPEQVGLIVLIFCRVGACLMLMPGFSSPRVPVRARLFTAISLTLALTPLLFETVARSVGDASSVVILRHIIGETVVGAAIGLFGRMFLLALESLGTAVAMSIGISSNLGVPVEGDDSMPALASFLTLTATVLVFVLDLHWEVMKGLVASYDAIPVSVGFGPQVTLIKLTDVATRAFTVALQITSPFIVFALVLNLAFALLNKMTPQVPVYFLAAPFVLMGGLALIYLGVKPAMQIFMAAFSAWLVRG